MNTNYIWTHGPARFDFQEDLDVARAYQRRLGCGQIWRQTTKPDGSLESIELIQEPNPFPFLGNQMSDQTSDSLLPPINTHIYGKDCPVGMVQIEFVGVDPSLKQGDYGYKLSSSAFLDIWVDGQRYRLDVGTYESSNGPRRGIRIVSECDLGMERSAINSVDLFAPRDGESRKSN